MLNTMMDISKMKGTLALPFGTLLSSMDSKIWHTETIKLSRPGYKNNLMTEKCFQNSVMRKITWTINSIYKLSSPKKIEREYSKMATVLWVTGLKVIVIFFSIFSKLIFKK